MQLFREWVEDEVVQHMNFVHASAVVSADVSLPVELPSSFPDLCALLGKLGFQVASDDHWALLGLDRVEGPDPSEALIGAR